MAYVPVSGLVPFARNARTHSEAQVAEIAGSIRAFGFVNPILVDEAGGIVAGHGRVAAARLLGLPKVPVIHLRGLTEVQRRQLVLADNRIALNAGWDAEMLRLELKDLKALGASLDGLGFSEKELAGALQAPTRGRTDPDFTPAPRATDIKRGDVFELGQHRLLCGDCTKGKDVGRLIASLRAALCVTSPPYASQRRYDETSGFRPVPPDEYVRWFESVQASIASALAADGSYLLNIKEHCEDGQRHLYVKDLTLAHVRLWGWRFIDEFCWRDTKNGVPGGWPNRFKDAWEPVFHFSRGAEIKLHPLANGTESAAVFDYSARTQKTRTGSGLLGVKATSEREGLARPSNVIECAAASTGGHSAAFPVALPAWFIRAFTDAGDMVLEPFSGSGTTLIAAEGLGRSCCAVEISPAYCQVAIDRWEAFTGKKARKVASA